LKASKHPVELEALSRFLIFGVGQSGTYTGAASGSIMP
jgi:hypothetical protein